MVNDDKLDPSMMSLLKAQIHDVYGVEDFEVIDWVPVLHSGWECDSTVAHVRLSSGRHLLLMPDGVNNFGNLADFLTESVKRYHEIGKRTEAMVASFGDASKRGASDAL